MTDGSDQVASRRRLAATTADATVLAELAGSTDLAVVCLVAGNRATSAGVVRALADHATPSVRRAIAFRTDVPTDLVARLIRDRDRSVRRAVRRHQPLDLDIVLALLQGGWWSPDIATHVRRLIDDPGVVRRLLSDPAHALLAAGGRVDGRTFGELVVSQPASVRERLAATCRFDQDDIVRLARDPERAVQEAMARRDDLSAEDRHRIVRRGGVWAVATAIASAPLHDPPLRQRFRPHRVVRRVIAAREKNRFVIWWWSGSRHWDVCTGLAVNPRLGRWSVRRLTRIGRPWVVSAALAGRADVASFAERLSSAAPVQLVLASNPASPVWVVEHLLDSPDPFVRGQAVGNQRAPVRVVRERLHDPTTPAWVVRCAAEHAALSPSERDGALAWIALGGAVGDPSFDPRTCQGDPGGGLSADHSYELEAQRSGLSSCLWRARVRWAAEQKRLEADAMQAVSLDGHSGVRRHAARVRLKPFLEYLRWDISPQVSSMAAHALGAGDYHEDKIFKNERTVLFRVLAVAAVVVAGIGGSALLSSPTERRPIDAAAAQQQARLMDDVMPRTELTRLDDGCVVLGVPITLGRDVNGSIAVSFAASPLTRFEAAFSLADGTVVAVARSALQETVTVVVPYQVDDIFVTERDVTTHVDRDDHLVIDRRSLEFTSDGCR